MSDKTQSRTRLEAQLAALARRTDELVRVIENLRGENAILRAHQTAWMRERADLMAKQAKLIDKQQLARDRVESLIARIHEMEHPT
ncbi:MAG: DUF904 domain-containing protein [Pseudomonadota bacterium]